MLSDEFISLSETYINVCVDLVKSDRLKKKLRLQSHILLMQNSA